MKKLLDLLRKIILYPLRSIGLLILLLFMPTVILFENRSFLHGWFQEMRTLIRRRVKWMTITNMITFMILLVGREEVLLLLMVIVVPIGIAISMSKIEGELND
ncbi:hypothetical protein SMD22_01645 (plasmid) [Brevibacillus halotolerans]|nr:hypothetical protein SMD22_01645 [Brevibacillus halotolerans]